MRHILSQVQMLTGATGSAKVMEAAPKMPKLRLGKSLPALIPATPENVAKAREFVLQKWIERFHERYPHLAQDPNHPEYPKDLSNSCKFTSLFAQVVFGGTLRGNEGHQYVELENGEILDLNSEAKDVAEMRALHQQTGKTGWHSIDGRESEGWHYHGDPHEHDSGFFGNSDHYDSMRSVLPRVTDWVREFLK